MWNNFVTRNFIPSALFVGAVSNLINFITLSRWCSNCSFLWKLLKCDFSSSRPCIKACSIRIYLTVLAFTDTFLLVSILLISKQFHDDAHSQTQEIYWQTFRLTQWFFTSFSKKENTVKKNFYDTKLFNFSTDYITVYLTLFIALDRYWSLEQQKQHQNHSKEVDENSSCRISNAKNTASSEFIFQFSFTLIQFPST